MPPPGEGKGKQQRSRRPGKNRPHARVRRRTLGQQRRRRCCLPRRAQKDYSICAVLQLSRLATMCVPTGCTTALSIEKTKRRARDAYATGKEKLLMSFSSQNRPHFRKTLVCSIVLSSTACTLRSKVDSGGGGGGGGGGEDEGVRCETDFLGDCVNGKKRRLPRGRRDMCPRFAVSHCDPPGRVRADMA